MPPLVVEGMHGTRRGLGGARREVSERVVLRAGVAEVSGWSLNLSRGGIRVIVEEPVELGAEYEFSVGDAPARKGRIVWVQDEADGQIIGAQFLDGDGDVPGPDSP
jgi:hypothetical protein